MTAGTPRADHAELARLAEAATPGEWRALYYCGGSYRVVHGPNDRDINDEFREAFSEQDARFIAAANPATVLALLSEIAALRARHETTLAGECPCCVLTRAECADAIAEIEIGRTQAERQRDDMAKALLSLAEGNLGDAPWQANYETIKQVARNALANQGADQ